MHLHDGCLHSLQAVGNDSSCAMREQRARFDATRHVTRQRSASRDSCPPVHHAAGGGNRLLVGVDDAHERDEFGPVGLGRDLFEDVRCKPCEWSKDASKAGGGRSSADLDSYAVAAVGLGAHLPLHEPSVPARNISTIPQKRVLGIQASAGAAAAHAGERSEVAGVLLLETLQFCDDLKEAVCLKIWRDT